MTETPANIERVFYLADVVCDGRASADDLAELDAILVSDETFRVVYLDYCEMHAALDVDLRAQRAVGNARQEIQDDLTAWRGEASSPRGLPCSVDGAARCTSAHGILSSEAFPSVGYLTGWPAAYLIAAVICTIGALVFAFVPVSHRGAVATSSNRPTAERSLEPQSATIVGRITGKADCRWAAPPPTNLDNGGVALGGRYALASGLLEITYHTGAKVILQGPVTYEVDSRDGGFLSVGKLTARVEKNEVASGQWPVASEKTTPSTIHHSPSSVPAPSLPTTHHPLFTIQTPTATVTDLGTEFGVEVGAEGGQRVWVFQGKVKVASLNRQSTREITLAEGQGVSVDTDGRMMNPSATDASAVASRFVRHLPRRDGPTVVSLADLVAGGDGFGRRTNWGISAASAHPEPNPVADEVVSSGHFQKYSGMAQIDGVFIPNGGEPELIDSAGHRFAFPATSGTTCGAVLACDRAARRPPPELGKRYPGIAEEHRVLLLHANAGITFDLAAIRAYSGGRRVSRFQSVAISEQAIGLSPPRFHEIWVIVDGEPRFHKAEFRAEEGPVEIDISLNESDRFLTLVTTDGGDSIDADGVGHHHARMILESRVTDRKEP